MKKLIITSLLCIGTISFSAEHREHKAHVHGAAKMGIAFDGLAGKITLELASEGIYGFEYAPKSEADKKKQQEGLKKLETSISEMVVMAPDLKCAFTKEKIEVDQHEGGKHSDIDANFNINCEKDPVGSTMTFNVQKYFPRLKDVDVQILAGDVQKSVEAKSNGFKVELKK